MQYYPQDTVASVRPPQNDSAFLSFAVDPDDSGRGPGRYQTFLNDHENFVWPVASLLLPPPLPCTDRCCGCTDR